MKTPSLHKEVEFKYDIKVTLADLLKATQNYHGRTYVQGNDYYFKNKNKDLIRFRDGEGHKELTVKRKINKSISVRDEVNITLDPDTDLDSVSKFLKLSGFELDRTIYKSAHIFYLRDHIVSYYFAKSNNKFKELLEIEIQEGTYSNTKQAKKRLLQLEKHYAKLGCEKSKRVNKSLYEIYS